MANITNGALKHRRKAYAPFEKNLYDTKTSKYTVSTDKKVRNIKKLKIIICVIVLIIFIFIGFIITDSLMNISEIPYSANDKAAAIITVGNVLKL